MYVKRVDVDGRLFDEKLKDRKVDRRTLVNTHVRPFMMKAPF